MSKAGKFEISVSEPYPVWCNLMINGEFVARFSHKELRDLQYAATKAIQEARIALKEDSEEV